MESKSKSTGPSFPNLLTQTQQNIALYLQNCGAPVGITQVAQAINRSYPTTKEHLEALVRFGCVRECLPRPRERGKRYEYISNKISENYIIELHEGRNKKSPPVGQIRKIVQPLSEPQMREMINKFSEGKWEPKIFKSAHNLPLGLARLYELAIEVAYGGKPPKEEFTNVEEYLKAFRNDLESTLNVVEAVLSNPKLKNANDAYMFLIHNLDPASLQEIIRKVQDLNREV